MTPAHDESTQEEIELAYDYVHNVAIKNADGFHGLAPWWYGWAIREAYLAGFGAALNLRHDDRMREDE